MTSAALDWSKSFMYGLHQTHFLLEKRLATVLAKAGYVSFSQFMILIALSCSGKASQRDIAQFLYLTEATVSRHIESLRRSGHLLRSANPKSKREHILTLSAAGKRELDKARIVIDKEILAIVSAIDDSEKAAITDALGKMLKQLTLTETITET